jgi:hypothetical protein
MVGPLRIRLGVILTVTAVFTFSSAAAPTNETAASEGTHYSIVGIYYVDATAGTITTFDPVKGEELPVDNP